MCIRDREGGRGREQDREHGHLLVIFLFQTGDVLVVHYTSVGWSPYFPLIAGLITEIGGLISHGAVVAREYGIPCIVSLPDATLKIPDGTFLCVCVCVCVCVCILN